jgi:hypothetical protein
MDEGIALLELAQNAYSFFIQQDVSAKRRLLNFVISNSVWDGENLIPIFKQPFNMVASSMIEVESKITSAITENEAFEKWLPGPDSNQRPSG